MASIYPALSSPVTIYFLLYIRYTLHLAAPAVSQNNQIYSRRNTSRLPPDFLITDGIHHTVENGGDFLPGDIEDGKSVMAG